MKLLVALALLYLALLLAAALLNHPASDAGVNAAPTSTAKAAQPKARTHSNGHGRPASASRSRHTEPPSRLDLLDWHALAMCESSNNPHAVSPSDRYRGLYQFNRETWESVGGTGDPAQASRKEQDYRALVLFMRRGRQPWPVCGSRL